MPASLPTHNDPVCQPRNPSRRALLARSGLIGLWLPFARIGTASATSCPVPPAFPAGIPLYRQGFKNWAGDIAVDEVWTCAPRTPQEVVQIANWARDNSYKMRPRGMMHNWSPLTLAPGTGACSALVLVDTTQYLTAISIDSRSSPASVTAQTGITMETLLTQLQQAGLGLTAMPAPGDLTLGGVLAIDAHGTAIPAKGERNATGRSFGSMSNAVLSLTAVVFDGTQQQYVLRTFTRDDPAIRALLTHLGRAFIVEAKLQAGTNYRLRCQSRMDISATELFAAQGSGGRTFASFLDSAGRAEAIWFPFTQYPWLKVWSVAPTKPLFSRQVSKPFNYPFSDNIPQQLSDLANALMKGQPEIAPLFGKTQAAITAAGLVSTLSLDLWGWSKDLLLYIKPTTLRVTANGYAVLMRRADIQRAVYEFTSYFQSRLAAWQASGRYPVNGPVEIRVTGLDQPGEVALPGAVAPALSALRPRPDHPEWDVAVWFDILTLPGTPGANAFYREIEQWMLSNYSGSYAGMRVEWSKGWAYGNDAAWSDAAMLDHTVPQSFRDGQPTGSQWNDAQADLNRYDPYRIFSSPLLDRLLP